jgi:hypothetical protein
LVCKNMCIYTKNTIRCITRLLSIEMGRDESLRRNIFNRTD